MSVFASTFAHLWAFFASTFAHLCVCSFVNVFCITICSLVSVFLHTLLLLCKRFLHKFLLIGERFFRMAFQTMQTRDLCWQGEDSSLTVCHLITWDEALKLLRTCLWGHRASHECKLQIRFANHWKKCNKLPWIWRRKHRALRYLFVPYTNSLPFTAHLIQGHWQSSVIEEDYSISSW